MLSTEPGVGIVPEPWDHDQKPKPRVRQLPNWTTHAAHIVWMLLHLMELLTSLNLSSFYTIIFSFFFSAWFLSITLHSRLLVHSSASSVVLIISSVLFLISFIEPIYLHYVIPPLRRKGVTHVFLSFLKSSECPDHYFKFLISHVTYICFALISSRGLFLFFYLG